MDTCRTEHLDRLTKQITSKMWQDNGLVMLNAILMGIVVVIGAYAPRYRHHSLIRFLFLGATTLFLPIVTTVVGTVANLSAGGAKFDNQLVVSECIARYHITLVLIWAGLVIIIAVNTSTAVAADPREKKNIFFPVELFLKGIWIAYITISTTSSDKLFRWTVPQLHLIFVPLYVLTFSKLCLRCGAFFIARRSYALGRNPKLIAGHMAELGTRYNGLELVDQHMHAPALVVTGEDTAIVKKNPHGSKFESIVSRRLVTLDRVWKLGERYMSSEHKDLCFSFSLFKLLRCQFARYTVLKPSLRQVQMFFRDKYLQGDDHERVFQVVADELSFIHDYYNSFLPISYSHHLFPFMNIVLSFLNICYCSYMFVYVSRVSGPLGKYGQIQCFLWCARQGTKKDVPMNMFRFGGAYFDVVPAYLAITVLMLSEMRDIVVYLCSNWTKVAFISNYTIYASWQQSLLVQKCIGFVFKCCRCRLTNIWKGTLNQCSLPVGSQNKKNQCSMFVLNVRRLLRLPNRKKIVVTEEVKASIFKALKGQISEQQDSVIKHIRPPSIFGFDIPINSDGKGTADIVLKWHIATSIFEARHLEQSSAVQISPAQISATQLSRYCTYLVACYPELLPGEDDEWCKNLFKAVKKNAEHILANQPECKSRDEEYSMLVNRLREEGVHDVLNKGAEIAEKLVKRTNGWEVLESFWSNMILYLAPSENLDGHAAAISRGGELITLLWALLAHLGIVGSLDAAAATTGEHV